MLSNLFVQVLSAPANGLANFTTVMTMLVCSGLKAAIPNDPAIR
jgi:hypothetical protein